MPNKPPPPAGLSAPNGSPQRLAAPDTVVVDGSFYLPALKRDAGAEYLAGHIPGRGALRHRRDRGSLQSPAAHAAERRRSSRARSARSASPTPTPSWSTTGRGSAVRRGCGGRFACSAQGTCSSSTAAFRSGRPRAGRCRPARSSAGRAGSTPGSTSSWSPASPTCATRCREAPRRWSMRGRPTAFAARRRSRGRACARATCRARSTYRPRRWSRTAGWSLPDRIAQIFAAGGVDLASRSSPAADRASPQRRCGSRSTPSASRRRRSTTAPGRNGDRAPTCRSNPPA